MNVPMPQIVEKPDNYHQIQRIRKLAPDLVIITTKLDTSKMSEKRQHWIKSIQSDDFSNSFN